MRFRREVTPVDDRGSVQVAVKSDAVPAQPLRPGAVPIGEVLLSRGSLTPAQLATAVVAQGRSGKRMGELLVELGLVDEREVIAALAEQLGLPMAELHQTTADPEVAALLSESVSRGLGAIPVSREPDGTIVVAICNPGPNLESELQRILGSPVRLALASTPEVQWAIDATHHALADVEHQVQAFTAVHGSRQAASATSNAIDAGASAAPVVKVVDMILKQALRDRASDVHIEPQGEVVRVRFRIDGALHEVLTLPGSMASALASRVKIMAGMSIVERRRPQDGQIAITLEDRSIDVRVSTTGVIWGEKVVLRILDKSRALYRMNSLGMVGETLAAYREMLHSPYGMVLCAGPTGSGKTTTLYASLNEVNSPENNITTIEDPVEYVFPSINQIQINETAGVTFAAGLRSILRQDPDMILVGEIRDVETARIAIQAALTGHFVLSSVHATDSVSSLYRFIDMGIESFLISASVLGIVGQRLVRRICDDCREPYSPSPEELAYYVRGGGPDKYVFWRGAGCNYCAHTGFTGRIGVYELLTVTSQMKDLLVRPGTTHADIRALAIEQGMRTLGSEGIRLVAADRTTIGEIIRSIYTL
ncbi:MAG: ATPase, T2SS/T4P/T4SS family [Candidatus Nanopelagicales bacterium]